MMQSKPWRNLIPLLLVVLTVAACGPASAAPGAQVEDPRQPAVPVEVAQAETGNIAATLSYSGDLQPGQSLQLVSIVAGAVEEVMVEVGDTVRAGDPILRVEDTTYRAQLKQAEAGLTVAQTNLIKMEKGPRAEQIALVETGLAVAQANLRKMQNGPRPEQLAMARAGVDAARGQLNSILTVTDDERTLAAANLAQTEAALKLAQFQYDQIKWAGQVGQTPQALQLQQATIAYETALAAYNLQVDPDESTLAPLKATIQQAEQGLALAEHPFTDEDFALVEAGVRQAELNLAMVKDPFTDEDFALARAGVAQAEAVVALAQYQVDNAILRAPFDGQVAEVYVTTGSVASPQSPAIKLISQDLEVLVDVPENQISTLHRNQPAALKVTAFPGQDFPALITSVAPAADSASHTFPVKISPLDEAGKLRAGMFADIAILLEEKTGVVLIPRSAVTIVRGQEVVYVVSADGKTVSMRPVVTGLSDDGRVEIVDGLAPDETVVVAGLSSLSDGAAVEIVARTE